MGESMKTYHGKGTDSVGGAKEVRVDGDLLTHIERHSPDGFNWGYGGSGPADLALSILTDLFGNDTAEQYYQKFKWDFISQLPAGKGWTLTEEQIRAWLQELRRRRSQRNI